MSDHEEEQKPDEVTAAIIPEMVQQPTEEQPTEDSTTAEQQPTEEQPTEDSTTESASDDQHAQLKSDFKAYMKQTQETHQAFYDRLEQVHDVIAKAKDGKAIVTRLLEAIEQADGFARDLLSSL